MSLLSNSHSDMCITDRINNALLYFLILKKVSPAQIARYIKGYAINWIEDK